MKNEIIGGNIELHHIPTLNNPADILMKSFTMQASPLPTSDRNMSSLRGHVVITDKHHYDNSKKNLKMNLF